MSTPSLGYEECSTLSANEVARIQLTEAIALFVAGKFLPAITLAGAAEEIFGKLLVSQALQPVVKESVHIIQQLRDRTGLFIMDGKTEKELVNQWNGARNAVKHLVGPEDKPLTLNLCDEAYWMIRRALANAQRLSTTIVNQNDFENWVIVNVTT